MIFIDNYDYNLFSKEVVKSRQDGIEFIKKYMSQKGLIEELEYKVYTCMLVKALTFIDENVVRHILLKVNHEQNILLEAQNESSLVIERVLSIPTHDYGTNTHNIIECYVNVFAKRKRVEHLENIQIENMASSLQMTMTPRSFLDKYIKNMCSDEIVLKMYTFMEVANEDDIYDINY